MLAPLSELHQRLDLGLEWTKLCGGDIPDDGIVHAEGVADRVIAHATVVGSDIAGVLQSVERPDVLVGLAGTVHGATIEGRWYDNDQRGPYTGSFVLSRPEPRR